MANYEERQGVDCTELSIFTEWNWEYEWWEATPTADCSPDTIEKRYFSGWGSTQDAAKTGARNRMASYEQDQDVDCTEESIFTEWDWELERWQATLTALCDFG